MRRYHDKAPDDVGDLAYKAYSVEGNHFYPFHIITPVKKSLPPRQTVDLQAEKAYDTVSAELAIIHILIFVLCQ